RQNGRYGMVIPRFVEAALRGGELPVHGDGRQTRCFVHVADAARAIQLLADCPAAIGGVFNVGSVSRISIADLAELVRRKVDARFGPRGSTIRLVPYSEAYGPGLPDMRARLPSPHKC